MELNEICSANTGPLSNWFLFDSLPNFDIAPDNQLCSDFDLTKYRYCNVQDYETLKDCITDGVVKNDEICQENKKAVLYYQDILNNRNEYYKDCVSWKNDKFYFTNEKEYWCFYYTLDFYIEFRIWWTFNKKIIDPCVNQVLDPNEIYDK